MPDTPAEETDLPRDLVNLMRVCATACGALAAAGIAVACFAYCKLPHPDEIRYAGRHGPVAQSIELYLFAIPAFQLFLFLLSAVLAWANGYRRHRLRQAGDVEKDVQSALPSVRPAPRESSTSFAYLGFVLVQSCAFAGTVCRTVVIAYGWR